MSHHEECKHLARAVDCGYNHFFGRVDNSDAFVGQLRCHRNVGCNYCAAMNRSQRKDHVTKLLCDLDIVWLLVLPAERHGAVTKQVNLKDGQYVEFVIGDGMRCLASNVAFKGGEPFTAADGIELLHQAVDRAPAEESRPFRSSYDWSIVRNAKPTEWVDYGKVEASPAEVREIAEACGCSVQASVEVSEDAAATGLERVQGIRLPLRFRTKQCLLNLRWCFVFKRAPDDGNLERGLFGGIMEGLAERYPASIPAFPNDKQEIYGDGNEPLSNSWSHVEGMMLAGCG